jgi:hypothetical protein
MKTRIVAFLNIIQGPVANIVDVPGDLETL